MSKVPAGALRPQRTKDEKHARRDPEQHRAAQPMSRFGQKKIEKTRATTDMAASASAAVVFGFDLAHARALLTTELAAIVATEVEDAVYEYEHLFVEELVVQ